MLRGAVEKRKLIKVPCAKLSSANRTIAMSARAAKSLVDALKRDDFKAASKVLQGKRNALVNKLLPNDVLPRAHHRVSFLYVVAAYMHAGR